MSPVLRTNGCVDTSCQSASAADDASAVSPEQSAIIQLVFWDFLLRQRSVYACVLDWKQLHTSQLHSKSLCHFLQKGRHSNDGFPGGTVVDDNAASRCVTVCKDCPCPPSHSVYPALYNICEVCNLAPCPAACVALQLLAAMHVQHMSSIASRAVAVTCHFTLHLCERYSSTAKPTASCASYSYACPLGAAVITALHHKECLHRFHTHLNNDIISCRPRSYCTDCSCTRPCHSPCPCTRPILIQLLHRPECSGS